MHDAIFMAQALELARAGRFTTSPNPNVGCVLVSAEGRVVGEGWHQQAGGPHAEIHALQQAGEQARGATAYVTLEPCSHFGRTPPCCDALIEAGIRRVVVAMQDPNPEVSGRGLLRLQQAGIEVSCGLMQTEAEALNRGFLKRMRTGFPFVQLKLAASLDGRTAMRSGESQWITSVEARRDVQQFRAQSCAILSSCATVVADNPLLTVRIEELDPASQQLYLHQKVRQPIRVIIDSQQQLNQDYRLFSQEGSTWVMSLGDELRAWPPGVRQFKLPELNGHVDLTSMMMLLAKQQINHLWVEAGASLAGALIQHGLVDELIVYLAPKLLGSDARGLCILPGLERLAEVPELVFTDIRQTGADLRLTLSLAQ